MEGFTWPKSGQGDPQENILLPENGVGIVSTEVVEKRETEKDPEKTGDSLVTEDKAEKFTKSLDLFSAQIIGFIEIVSKDQSGDSNEQKLPEDPEALRAIIDGYRQGDKEMGDSASLHLEILKNATKEIEKLKLTSRSDLAKIESLLKAATEADIAVKKQELERKAKVDLFNAAVKKLKELALKDAGLDSFKGVDRKYYQLRDDIDSQKGFLGWKKVFNRDKINGLVAERKKLGEIRSLSYLSSISYYDTNSYKLEEAEGKVLEVLLEDVKVFSDVSLAEISKSEQGLNLEISPAVVDELDDSYIDKVVRKDIAEALKEYRKKGRSLEDFGTKEQREQLMEVLKKSYSIDMDSRRIDESEEAMEKRREIQAAALGFPSRLNDFGPRLAQKRVDDVWTKFSKGILGLKKERYLKNLEIDLQAIGKACSSSNHNKIRFMRSSTEKYCWPVLNKNERDNGEDMVHFDAERWNIFKDNENVKKSCGEKILEQYQEVIEERILGTLCGADRQENDYALLTRLMELRSAKATPFVLLDAFRVAGDGGGHHLIDIYGGSIRPDQTGLYKYISSLSKSDLEKIKDLNIPGVTEAIKIIQDNKDNFCLELVRGSANGDKMPWVDNPVYEKIHDELERISCHYLWGGDKQEKMFVLRTLQSTMHPLGGQANVIEALLKKGETATEFNSIEHRASQVLLTKFKYRADFQALSILTESSDVSEDDTIEILKVMAFYWDNVKQNFESEESGKNTGLIGNNLRSIIKELTGSSNVNKKFTAYAAAHNLGLEFQPSPGEIIEFIESKEDLERLDGMGHLLDTVVALAEKINFTDEESAKITKTMMGSPDTLDNMAFDWDKMKNKFEGKDLRLNLEVVNYEVGAKVKELIESKNIRLKYVAYVISNNFDLGFQPTSSEIIELIKSKKEISQWGSSGGRLIGDILKFSEKVTFTGEESAEFVKLVVADHKYFSNHNKDRDGIVEFVKKLPTSEKLSEEDKRALISMPEFLATGKLTELLSDSGIKITGENWTTLLRAYILSDGGELKLGEEQEKVAKKMFSNEHPENRDFCLGKLQNLWKKYLEDKDHVLPIETFVICQAVEETDNQAGDLKYISALTNIINSVNAFGANEKTALHTKGEIFEGLEKQEKRMMDGRWGEDDKAIFYNVSNSLIKASPSLYTDFVELFGVMSSKELKKFAKDIYPLYQANLIVLEKGDNSSFKGKDLVPIRKRLEAMKDEFKKEGVDINNILRGEQIEITKSIKQEFEKRFGLLKIPENLTEENIRTLQNCVRYVGNINKRNTEKEALVSLYLGLSLNGEWEDFRSGKEIDLAEYFGNDQQRILRPILEKRKELNKVPSEIIGLSPEETLKFQKSMQEETITNMIGNVETIDVKLGNTKRSLEDLADPDVYPDETDREVLALVKREGRLVGATLSKIFAEVSGKKVEFSEGEKTVRGNLEIIYKIDKWTPKKVKETQDLVQTPNLICSVLRKIDEEKVDETIEKLQTALAPSKEVTEIFNSFGEEFKASSGAMALSQDLSYLENIIVKNDNKISAEQRKTLNDYLGEIRSQMAVMETVYDHIKEYFEKIKKGSHTIKNEILKSRLDEIEKVLYRSDSAVAVTTIMTNNLNLIIENMRQCLGCKTKEINNDTNLTFGDLNKFYTMSQGEKQKGSISDEIVFFSPVTLADGSREMSFVMDKIYESNSLDIMTSHIKTVVKKCSLLKQEFPEAKISIFVADSALIGSTKDRIEKEIKEVLTSVKVARLEGVKIDIQESALGDHYVEFGDKTGRHKGESSVSGLRITV